MKTCCANKCITDSNKKEKKNGEENEITQVKVFLHRMYVVLVVCMNVYVLVNENEFYNFLTKIKLVYVHSQAPAHACIRIQIDNMCM